MKKIFNWMLIAVLAIGISSCSKDVNDGAGLPDQPKQAFSNEIDWSVFEHLGADVVNDLKQLVDGPQTRAAGNLRFGVSPDFSDIPGTGMDVTVKISKNTQDAWPANVIARLVQHPNMNQPILAIDESTFAGDDWIFTWHIPAYYSSVANDSRVLIYQISVDNGATWTNPKVALQYAMVGEFMTDLSITYSNSRIPENGGPINILRLVTMVDDATFRIRSLDDDALLADPVIIFAGEDMASEVLSVKPNPSEVDVIPFVIEYRLTKTPAGEWIELERGLQETGKKVQINDAILMGSPWIKEVGETRTLELDVEYCVEDEIKVRIVPYLHSAYTAPFAIETTAYLVNPSNTALNGWKFEVEFPAARGISYSVGDEAGGWHINYQNELKAGINGAGLWAVEYEYPAGTWNPLNNFLQRAYYIGVKNDTPSLYKQGGDWIVRTQGNWPAGSVQFRTSYQDNSNVWHPTAAVSVNSVSSTTDSWEYAPAMVIPTNTEGYALQWKFQYLIDDIGVWKTWDTWNVSGKPEYGWEGRSNQLVQYHF